MPESFVQHDIRESFYSRLDDFVARHAGDAKSFALLIVNINQFRRFNTYQGYRLADELLAAFAAYLANVARPQDYIARIGNADYAMLLPDIHNEGHASLAAIKLIENLKEPLVVSQSPYRITANVGIALYPQHAEDGEDLFKCAELALNDSRNSLQSYSVFTNRQQPVEVYDWNIENDLQKAIEKDQFDLHFQPQIDLCSGRLFGVEALIRWHNGERGFIRPDVFIPLAESSGQIVEITQWTLNSALWFLQSWPRELAGMKVAVNISTKMLSEADFADMVANAVGIYGVDYSQLTLEITESALVEDVSTSFRILGELRSLGLNISIDDFGTGYSSMSYFKGIPATELKIDQSFIRHVLDNQMDEHIVQTVIQLANGFDLTVVAEGIEDQETFDKLNQMGCDIAQGYHIARPMPRDDILHWVEHYRATHGASEGKIETADNASTDAAG